MTNLNPDQINQFCEHVMANTGHQAHLPQVTDQLVDPDQILSKQVQDLIRQAVFLKQAFDDMGGEARITHKRENGQHSVILSYTLPSAVTHLNMGADHAGS